ncbi:hypothetical protein RvY_05110 [Ramazzottius varieornatus]|uniref:FYVE-type domain-containing protein n=1 Tax=Ramazzottius varieornatus TaxID=947166 RepID=A0A1D1V2Z6_RAMVA|nr:hypothetical protein RvY_05110 [Ramazzottius varieornatus]
MAQPSRRTSTTPMTSRGFSSAEVVVREGFICPICMQDLGSIDDLQDHFESDHAEEDRTLLQQLKGLVLKRIGRAESPVPFRSSQAVSSDDEGAANSFIVWDDQTLGARESHTDYFKKIRDSRLERIMVETNKLIIRLDKLAHEAPSDPKQRAAFEKHLASWAPDHDVPICPNCGKTFRRFMRKHHCRLCGCIVCSDCSRFLSEDFAERLTNPTGNRLAPEKAEPSGSPARSVPGSISSGSGIRARSNSNESIMSIVSSLSSKDKEQTIRTCEICQNLLERRLKQTEDRYVRVQLEDLHERLALCINDSESLYPGYLEMTQSLQMGESNYQLPQAAEIRTRLMRLLDEVGALSKQIAALPPTGNPREDKLRSNIRSSAVDFLKSRISAIPALPSAEELAKLQQKRREEVKQRIAAQRASEEKRKRDSTLNRLSYLASKEPAHSTPKKEQPKNPFDDGGGNPFEEDASEDELNPFNEPDGTSPPPRQSNSGWAPEPLKQTDFDEDDDPLLQQITRVKITLEQAKDAGRVDEAASLSRHLTELEDFYKQKVIQQL